MGIYVSAYNCGSCGTYSGIDEWIVVRFKVTAGTAPFQTAVSVKYSPNATDDSNVTTASSASDALGTVFHKNLTLHGSARDQPILVSFQPEPYSSHRADVMLIRAEIHEPFGQLQNVEFHVFRDNAWHLVGKDTEGSDGWSVLWDTSQIGDQEISFRVTAHLPGTQITSWELSEITIDRTYPEFVSSSFDPPSPSGASSIDIQVSANDNLSSSLVLDMFVNTASDGSDSGEWIHIASNEDVATSIVDPNVKTTKWRQ